ncbi:MAG: 50S ribosomal protein L4 [Candidatus Lokiarchaeota archaeon]|nr:50S ribosomal protein L4 [Candidatus Lokiarchaeota archaeon]
MANINVYGLDGEVKQSIRSPTFFSMNPRKDIISRVVSAIETSEKQPQGRDPLAGTRNTAKSWGSGYAAARIPRKKGSGYPGARNAAFIPRTVGGRLAWPPTSEKKIPKSINRKEKKLGLLNAIVASSMKDVVVQRGHKIEKVPSIPLVVDDKIQTIKTTSEILKVFNKLGLSDDIERVKSSVKIRSGKGKRRGRKYKKRKSLLVVVKDNFGIFQATRNIPGVDIVEVSKLNCRDLAPGALPGRLTLWSHSAFKQLNNF